jgi:hypothetical protein
MVVRTKIEAGTPKTLSNVENIGLYSPECVEGVFSEVEVPHRTGTYSRSRIFMHHHYM